MSPTNRRITSSAKAGRCSLNRSWAATLIRRLHLVLILAAGCACPEQWRPGALIPSGSGDEVLGRGNGLFFTLGGDVRISRAELQPRSLLHGLILAPDVDV